MSSLIVALHVGTAVVWIAGSALTGHQGSVAYSSGSRQQFVSFLGMAERRGPILYMPCALVMLASGAVLAQMHRYSVPTPLLLLGFLLLVTSVLVGAAFVGPWTTALRGAAESSNFPPFAFTADFNRILIAHYVKLTCLTSACLVAVLGVVL